MICWPDPAVRICCEPPPGLLMTMVCFPPTVAICTPDLTWLLTTLDPMALTWVAPAADLLITEMENV